MASGYNPYAAGGAPPVLHQPQPYTPPSGGQIVPGTITYTTSTGVDGRVIYHPFKYVFYTPTAIFNALRHTASLSLLIVMFSFTFCFSICRAIAARLVLERSDYAIYTLTPDCLDQLSNSKWCGSRNPVGTGRSHPDYSCRGSTC